ncbi:unnamed protein product [Prunus armeniaca]|uniref:Uncharacterized protein n=1 Tax=Prunus armeniaca TaxID=36596 RepID=A0A6J5WV46_PRUAR|nr:unnamed protein product [Prunus armeniaca]
MSRTLYLVEPEDSSGFDLKDHDCNRSRVLSKYKFPLRDAEELLNNHRNGMPSKTWISSDSGFGFSPRTNEYKVIRILNEGTPHPNRNRVVVIHKLGTVSWKSAGTAPCSSL